MKRHYVGGAFGLKLYWIGPMLHLIHCPLSSRGHKQMHREKSKRVTYLLSHILPHPLIIFSSGIPCILWPARDFSLMNAQSALEPTQTFCIPQSPLARSSQVYEHAEPHPSFPSLPKSHKHLMMPPNSYPEMTPETAHLHFLLIWAEIRHSRLLRMNSSQLFPVRWAFLSKKLTLC